MIVLTMDFYEHSSISTRYAKLTSKEKKNFQKIPAVNNTVKGTCVDECLDR